MSWSPDLALVSALLAAAGFDVDSSRLEQHHGGSVTARRDRGSESTIVAVDAGGRIRLTITQEREPGEQRDLVLGSAELQLVVTLQRTLTLTGQLGSIDEFAELIRLGGAGLVRLATAPNPPREAPSSGDSERENRPWWARDEDL